MILFIIFAFSIHLTACLHSISISITKNDDFYVNDEPPKALPLRPIIRGPYNDNGDDDDQQSDTRTVYTEQHTEVKLNCEVDLDIAAVVWMHNGQVNYLFIINNNNKIIMDISI